jgi:hypothetical protein
VSYNGTRLVADERGPAGGKERRSLADRLALTSIGLAAAVASWNGIHVPLFSHFFFLFLALAAGAVGVGTVGRRAGHTTPSVPAWLVAVAATFLALGLCDALIPISATASRESAYEISSSGTFFDLSSAGLGTNFGNLVRLEIGLFVLPALIVAVANTSASRRMIADAWLLGTALSASVAVVDGVLGTTIGGTLTGTAASVAETHRQVGFTSQPNHLGLSCALVIPIATLWLARPQRAWRVLAAAVLAFLVAAIITSGSRGAAVAGLAAAFATVLVVPKLRPYAAISALGLVCIAVLLTVEPKWAHSLGVATRLAQNAPGVAASDAGRSLLRSLAISQFTSRPFTGVGFAELGAAHTIYIELLATGGVAGLLAFGVFASCCVASGLRALGTPNSDLVAACVVSFVAWLAVGVVENQMTDGYLYVAPGLVLAAAASLAAHGQLRPPSNTATRARPVPGPDRRTALGL